MITKIKFSSKNKIKAKYNRKSINMPLICIRESDFLWKHNVLVYKSLLRRFPNKHILHIPINSFGAGLKIMHLGPILVNGKVKCGKNISLHIILV